MEGLLPGLEPAECCKGSCAHREEDHCCPSIHPCPRVVDKTQYVKLNSEMQ